MDYPCVVEPEPDFFAGAGAGENELCYLGVLR